MTRAPGNQGGKTRSQVMRETGVDLDARYEAQVQDQAQRQANSAAECAESIREGRKEAENDARHDARQAQADTLAIERVRLAMEQHETTLREMMRAARDYDGARAFQLKNKAEQQVRDLQDLATTLPKGCV